MGLLKQSRAGTGTLLSQLGRLTCNAQGAPTVNGGRPCGPLREDQTWPAFSSAEQQVSTSRRVTTYGSTLAFGRRSSM
ncbi:hypothetical protein GCM10010384_53660 [Streptomyces djakartensis]|uniref:Uncharacterized protein n=1 Tax=Streptomyces djakartensis TaxID=68193 RepID=A0ABQ3A7N2_9ACTN|nr:hypothetical protein GCM10010384_53660 [Streptomyces djakartensis]